MLIRSHAGEPGLHILWTLRQMHFLEPDVLEATPMGHDPVIEGDASFPPSQLTHLKTATSFSGYIQTAAVAVGRTHRVTRCPRCGIPFCLPLVNKTPYVPSKTGAELVHLRNANTRP